MDSNIKGPCTWQGWGSSTWTLDYKYSAELHHVLPAAYNPCFAHTVQLFVKDGFKEAQQLNKVLNKTSKLVRAEKYLKLGL